MTAGLIADIGATNARFALADKDGIHDEKILKCGDYPGILEASQDYLAKVKSGGVKTASVAIAGPVTGDRFRMTNHPWDFSVEVTRRALGLDRFHLMNHFAALALAVPHLAAKDIRQNGEGKAAAH